MSHTADQTPVIAFLADPATHGVAAVDRLETHISVVVLAGDRAFKLKKAVTLPFLDFAPLAAREAACRAEVNLNRRTAPELYVGVRAVTRDDAGRLSFDGTGEVVDWVVEMRRFDQDGLLDHVAVRDGLSRDLMLDLAEAIVAFHDSAEVTHNHGGAAAVRDIVEGNARSFAPFAGGLFPEGAVDRVISASLDRIDTLTPLLDARRDAGKVRRCHGDLHLRNIALVDGKPLLFDCIEFSDAFSYIDVAYDLAFLLMDLMHAGFRLEASVLLNHALALSDDLDCLAVLPLFLSMRAQIRAHISAQIATSMADPAPLQDQARAYLVEAQAYLTPPPPVVVAVGGLSGSGKSRCARLLAPQVGAAPGAMVMRTDVLRKRLAGCKPWQKLPKDAYTAEASQATYDALIEGCRRVLATGHSVIADAVFAKPAERAAIAAVAEAAGVPFAGLWLEAEPEVAARRIRRRRRNASDATVEVLERQMTYDLGVIDWTRIDSSGLKDQTIRDAHAALKQTLPTEEP